MLYQRDMYLARFYFQILTRALFATVSRRKDPPKASLQVSNRRRGVTHDIHKTLGSKRPRAMGNLNGSVLLPPGHHPVSVKLDVQPPVDELDIQRREPLLVQGESETTGGIVAVFCLTCDSGDDIRFV